MARNTFSKYNDEFAYWCPDCDYKTNEKVSLDIHVELNEDLIDAIEVWKIYKLLQQMKNK